MIGEDGRAAIEERIMKILKEFDGTPTMRELSETLRLGYHRTRNYILSNKELAKLALSKGMRLKSARSGEKHLYENLVKRQKIIELSSALCTARLLEKEIGDGLVLDISNGPVDGFQSAWNCLGWNSENIYTMYPDARVLTRFGGTVKTTRLIAGSCEAVPVRGGSFDYAILTHIIHRVNDPVKIGGVLKEMNRVLKNKGTLVITAPETYEPGGKFFNQVKDIGFAAVFAGSSAITYNGGAHEKDHIDTFIQLKKIKETGGDAVVSPFFHLLLEPETKRSFVEASEAKEAEVRKVARRFFWDPTAVSFNMSKEEIEAKMSEDKYEFIKSLRKLPINRAQGDALIKMLVRKLVPRRENSTTPANEPRKVNSRRRKLRM